jgi:hypothetical protein
MQCKLTDKLCASGYVCDPELRIKALMMAMGCAACGFVIVHVHTAVLYCHMSCNINSCFQGLIHYHFITVI